MKIDFNYAKVVLIGTYGGALIRPSTLRLSRKLRYNIHLRVFVVGPKAHWSFA